MDIKPIYDSEGNEYTKADITLNSCPIFRETDIQYAIVLVLVPYRYDSEDKIIANYDIAIREVLPDITQATPEQQAVISNVDATLVAYLNKKYGNG